MNEIKRIINLSNAFGPSGLENEVVELIKQENFSFKEDKLRNLYVNDAANCEILLDAHSDEVGFIIQGILSNGMLRFLPLGGWDIRNVVGSEVLIQTQNHDKIIGIVASKPVHFMRDDEKNQPLGFNQLVIDVGATCKKEVMESFGINIGDFVVPYTLASYDEQRHIFKGKAFDDRIGIAALLQTLTEINESSKKVGATITAQEEVGERGMMCAIHQVSPKVVIAFEGCPADDSFEGEDMIQSGMKRGVMLRYFDRSMITSPTLMHLACSIAQEKGIKYQVSVRSGGGTNGGITHVAHQGIPSIILGIPVRYAHSTSCFCAYDDYRSAIELAKALIQALDDDTINKL